ncbi:S2-RNase [Pyrus ussuriensis x Pyrus communis]|uniref:S2-RNase n=1 Tax=Pyrus ussuriensis x Pyrus communis TaxID=2448454 RepID=A0A5N5G313_9ROSA|nr:S2-RNase [Pyrus ussuriensis x Pyrus communis]
MKVEWLGFNDFCKWERKWTEVKRLGCGNNGIPKRSDFAWFYRDRMGENGTAIMKSGAGNAKASWKGKEMHCKVCGSACECMFWCWKCKRELEMHVSACFGTGNEKGSWKCM